MLTQRFLFAFKYKLVILIVCIVWMTLAGGFFVVQRNIETRFIASIKQQLVETEQLISELMDNRLRELKGYAIALHGRRLIRAVLLDKTMDRVTRDDILEEEILPDFPVLSHIVVADADGHLLATNQHSQNIVPQLQTMPLFSEVIAGESNSAYLFDQQACIQILGLPIFLREEMIGMLFVGITLTPEYLSRIQSMTSADLALFRQQQVFLASNWQRKPEQRTVLLQALEQVLQQNPQRWTQQKFAAMTLMGERFLSITVSNHVFVPPYLLAVSLDQALGFVEQIRAHMLWIGSIGLLFGVLTAFVFALGISKPIEALRYATTEVERENFNYQIDIKTRDEFSLLGQSFNHMLMGLAEKDRIRGAMNKVVSKEIADELLKDDIKLGGEERVATVLCTDIRGFTTLSEGLAPEQLLSFLNDYFTRQSFCIDAHQGVIDKYVGDAMMALFGVPVAHDNDASEAVMAALDIIEALDLFELEVAQPMQKEIGIGIAINTGLLVAGNVGAENRLNYTVLGDAVNTAFRLEGLTKRYGVQIIISEGTYKTISSQLSGKTLPFKLRFLDCVQVKGKTEGVKIYQVFPRQIIAQGGDLERLASVYKKAWQKMQQAQFEQAILDFNQLSESWPEDIPCQIMQQRCKRYQTSAVLFSKEYVNGAYVYHEK